MTVLEAVENTHFETEDFRLDFCLEAVQEYTKVSYPIKYGLSDFVFEFNLNHEIRQAKSKKNGWIHPQEWLKRTMGNDWVYYSSGGYAGVFEALGEYYLPNLSYTTNSLVGGKPFQEPLISHIVNNWHALVGQLAFEHCPGHVQSWFQKVLDQTPEKNAAKASQLNDIIGSRVSVMPPDARHVDYNIIPVHISDGCLYKCRFCKIKNKKDFSLRTGQDIKQQIEQLRTLYDKDLKNYNGLFLGEHDALNAPGDLILESAMQAYDRFEFDTSFMNDQFLFFFGSADALLNKPRPFFEQLNKLPYQSFINIGLESYDQQTLDKLGKPVTAERVRQAFEKVQLINQSFTNVELSCNFIMDDQLGESHHSALMELIRHSVSRIHPKGNIYLSPLAFGRPSRQVLYDFYRIKSQSRFPTYLYIIQRL